VKKMSSSFYKWDMLDYIKWYKLKV
jgi:hypothetical protein